MELYSQDGSGKYAALGLSEDPRMGDDLVLSCAEVSGKTLRRKIFILVMFNYKFYKNVFNSRLVARCSLALAGTVVVLIRCRRLGEDSSKTCKWKIGGNNCGAVMKVKVKKGGQWSSSPGAVDLIKWKYKLKIGKSDCGAIVKVKEEQWSFSSGDLVNTQAKHA